jgi:general secretion pathway protein G
MLVRNTNRIVARAAFTLMEMLVVVAILVVLAGVGGYYYMKHLDEARISAARLQIKVLTDAAEAYYTKHGEWPASLATLTEKEADGSRPYLEPDALKTPWQTAYQYDPSGPNNAGNKPDIWADAPQVGRVGNWSGQRG